MAAAADITALFKASVKTVKTRNKALGVPPGGAEPAALWPRRAPGGRGGFSARAREVAADGVIPPELQKLLGSVFWTDRHQGLCNEGLQSRPLNPCGKPCIVTRGVGEGQG